LADIIDFNTRREALRVARDESALPDASENAPAIEGEVAGVYAGFGTEADALLVWHESPMPSATPRRCRGSILRVVLDNVAAVWFGLLVQSIDRK
jgi:hypothetical protein